MEEKGTLCYLDVKITRQETGTFKFTVFRKACEEEKTNFIKVKWITEEK